MTFRHLGFQQKMLAAPAIAALGFGILLALGLWLGGRSLESLSKIEETHFPLVELNRDLEALLKAAQRELVDAVASDDATGFESADKIRDKFFSRLSRARDSGVVRPGDSDSLRMRFSDYYDLARLTSSHLIRDGFDEAIADDLRNMSDQYNQLRDELENRTRAARRNISDHFAEARGIQRLFLQILIGVLIACTIILIVLSRKIAISVSRPLYQIMEAVDRARDGDLTVELLVDRDTAGGEIADLQRGFDSMIRNLRGMVANTGSSALGLSETAQLLRESGKELHEDNATQETALARTMEFMELVRSAASESLDGAQSLGNLAKSCAGSVTELNGSIARAAGSIDQRFRDLERVASAVVELTRSIPAIAQEVRVLRSETDSAIGALSGVESGLDEASHSAALAQSLSTQMHERALDGLKRVDQTNTSMHEIEKEFQRLAEVVGGLSSRSRSIGEITKVIDKVADDTSLLALNASITAAQSGVHGRSFAVVAGEMRTLAKRTAQSTSEIRSVVDEVQPAIAEAVVATDNVREQVGSGVSLALSARELLVEIRDSAAACTAQVARIVSQSGEHRSDVMQVAEVVRGVEQTAVQFEQMMEQQNRVAQEVQRSTEVMNEFFELIRSTSTDQRNESTNLAGVAAELASSSDQIAACVNAQNAQGEHVRQALDALAAALAGNRARAKELENTVRSLSQQSAELDRNVSRFRI